MPESTDAQTATEQALVIERIFDAPVEMVWRAWTQPEHFKRWWGPKGYSSPAAEIDLRVGGKFLAAMRSPEGQDIWSTGLYREIVPLKRLVTTDSFADENGNVVPASHYAIDADMPLEMLVTVTFEDLGGRTKLTLRHEGLPAGEMGEGAAQGWNESLDKLADSLAA
jgi:uncharacterized protein YndB with AHSA1/START domain